MRKVKMILDGDPEWICENALERGAATVITGGSHRNRRTVAAALVASTIVGKSAIGYAPKCTAKTLWLVDRDIEPVIKLIRGAIRLIDEEERAHNLSHGDYNAFGDLSHAEVYKHVTISSSHELDESGNVHYLDPFYRNTRDAATIVEHDIIVLDRRSALNYCDKASKVIDKLLRAGKCVIYLQDVINEPWHYIDIVRKMTESEAKRLNVSTTRAEHLVGVTARWSADGEAFDNDISLIDTMVDAKWIHFTAHLGAPVARLWNTSNAKVSAAELYRMNHAKSEENQEVSTTAA